VPETYVHRIGRTARAGAEGIAISLCDSEEMAFLRDIEKLIRVSIPMSDRRADQRQPRHGSRPAVDAGERHWRQSAQSRKQDRRRPANGSTSSGIASVAFLHRHGRPQRDVGRSTQRRNGHLKGS
jgi:ATP-dependent RNA helicase RhlE